MSSHSLTPRPPFTLPALPNTSSSSLLDAVVGHHNSNRPVTTSLGLSNTPSPISLLPHPRSPENVGDQVLVEASSRVNGVKGKGDENVDDLEKELQKRRSIIPHLESELADLKAQIQATEARLARVQAGGTSGVSEETGTAKV